MVARREAAHDAAFLRLDEAQAKLSMAEASGRTDSLIDDARHEVDKAMTTFTVAQDELKAARARFEQHP